TCIGLWMDLPIAKPLDPIDDKTACSIMNPATDGLLMKSGTPGSLRPQNSHYTHVALQPRRCEPGHMYSFHRLLYRGNQMYTRRNIDGRRAQGGHLIQTVQSGEKNKPSRN